MKTLLSDKEHYPHLFSPAVIRGKYFKNRIIASPHGCRLPVLEIDGTGYAHITELGIKYYAGPAKGGAAVVNMMEGGVEPGGGGIVTPSYNLFKPNTLATMHLFTDYVHAYGALASMELTHIGQWSKNAVGPTEKILYTGAKVHELTEKDIDEIVRYYSNAANMVRRGGFDVIMLHGGHNWLLSQFMSPYENKRTDRFGGSPENRIRLASMVLDAIRDRIGGDLVIEFRISLSEFTNGGVTPEDAVEMLKFIEDILGVGGAMDLLEGAGRIICTMTHIAKTGEPKILKECTYPLTSLRRVDTVITELAVFRFRDGKMYLTELMPGATLEEVQVKTAGEYTVALG